MWPSGKAPLFGSGIRRFESYHPSHYYMSKEVLLSIQECTFSYAKTPILKNISIAIHNLDKIALVGKNGVGKSTLLQIIQSKKEPESGDIWINPKVNIGYLKQKNNLDIDGNVRSFLIKELEPFEIINLEVKIRDFCIQLKIDENQDLKSLSGGSIRKLILAKLLILKPRILLLDEPTNHLDIDSILWLENYLKNDFKGAFLVISHDRIFLNNITNKVFWMDRGGVKISPRGFKNFDEWSQGLIEHERRTIKNKSNLLKQELEWLSKGVKARRKRNERRKDNVFLLKDELKKENSEFIKSISKVKFEEKNFSELGPNVICQFSNVSKKYKTGNKDAIIMKDFNYKFHRSERIGVIGTNGSGKTTFFKLLIQSIKPDIGVVKLRNLIEYSYFDQKGEQLDDKKSLKENLIMSGGDYIEVNGTKKHICGYLKNFLFDPSSVNDLVSTLSGGQRNRLLLAKILANPKQLLILDEPTNDLDMETLNTLVEFLDNYNGTVLISSHDRSFLDKTVEKLFYFHGDGKIEISLQKCSDFLELKGEKKYLKAKNKNLSAKKIKPKNSEKILNQMLKKIEKTENEISLYTQKLTKDNLYIDDNNEFQNLINKIKDKQNILLELEKKWIEIEKKQVGEKK